MRIELNGPQTMRTQVGATFTDPGAHAYDSNGQEIAVQTVGQVDTTRQSTHTLVYSAEDDAGCFCTALRVVTVGPI